MNSIEAIDQGIVPSDGKDDSVALQALIDRQPLSEAIQINLPIGEIDLFKPISIDRSYIRIKGQGVGRTILQAQFNPTADSAILIVSGSRVDQTVLTASAPKTAQKPVQDVQVSGFTLRYSPSTPGIANQTINGLVLDNVAQVTVSNLHLEQGIRYPSVLERSRDVTMQYVTAEDEFDRNKVVMNDAASVQLDSTDIAKQ